MFLRYNFYMRRYFLKENLKYYNSPNISIVDDTLEFITKPNTDLWQNTYYNFKHDNVPFVQMNICEKYFSFTVKVKQVCPTDRTTSTGQLF